MRKLTVVLLMILVSGVAVAQHLEPVQKAAYIKSYATYTNATIDTTGWISGVPGVSRNIGELSELVLLISASDSMQAAVYVLGKNTKITVGGVAAQMHAVYADSASTILGLRNANAGFVAKPWFRAIVLKGNGVNRIPGIDAIKVAIDFTAASSDNAGRVAKLWLWGKE